MPAFRSAIDSSLNCGRDAAAAAAAAAVVVVDAVVDVVWRGWWASSD